jgi:hypothetical protein
MSDLTCPKPDEPPLATIDLDKRVAIMNLSAEDMQEFQQFMEWRRKQKNSQHTKRRSHVDLGQTLNELGSSEEEGEEEEEEEDKKDKKTPSHHVQMWSKDCM